MTDEELTASIKDNPGAILRLDNDWWGLYKPLPKDADEDDDEEEIVSVYDPPERDLLVALAGLAGLTVEHV